MSIRTFSQRRRLFAVLGLAALGLAAALLIHPATSPAQAQQEPAIAHAKALSKAFRKAAEASMPSVVKITVRTKAVSSVKSGKRPNRENPFKGTPFEDFFNDGTLDQIPSPRREGVGSGVIIDAAGIVLTNNHVVEGADEVVIHLPDGREFKSTEIKTDSQTDLAVVRIAGAGKLPAAKLGDSDQLDIGDWVIAVGHPFELETTVSAGIISGKGRSLGSVERAKFLQTDAAINPGNSGGPLVNLDGEVIGINTAIASNNGGYQGIGFAVPINLAKWVTTQLIERGSVQRAYLGVTIEPIDVDLAKKFNVKPGEGVLVTEVLSKGPAADASIREGDLILEFAGQRVSSPRDLQELVERAPLDSKQNVLLTRDGKTTRISITMKALPDQVASARRPPRGRAEVPEANVHEHRESGVEVSELTSDVADRLGYSGMSGVLISGVQSDSVAANKGLREGMLILSVDRKPVASLEQFKAAMEGKSLKDGVLLLVRVGNGNRFVVLSSS